MRVLTQADPAAVRELLAAGEFVWLDLVSPTEEERALAERATGLRVPAEEELAEIENSSRVYAHGDTLFLSTPMSYRSEDGNSRVAPLGFVVSPRHLITVRFAPLTAFDRFAEPGIQPTGERALGLGLPLAKQFAEAHGGRIALVSEPGEGTLITVELPRR